VTLNIDYTRSQFPALSREWVFFDNAGGTQILKPVVRRIVEYFSSSNVQLGASYDVSRVAVERVAAAAEAMAAYVNAPDASEVVMGPSTSMLVRILSLCLCETWAPGDEVIVTNCDHEANIGPWVDLAKKGITVKTWRLNPDTLDLHLEDLKALMTERTRLVAVTHCSNILGRINPVRDIARFVHDRGALVCVDGVAYAPHRRIDVQELDVDFYAFSFYKTYGPHYALLYGKRDHLLRMPGINHFFIGETDVPYKFQPGSVNYELSYGMLGLWDYLNKLAETHGFDGGGGASDRGYADASSDRGAQLDFVFDLVARYEETLAARLLDYLASKPGVRLIGPPAADRALRAPTMSFVVEGRKSDSITLEVDKHKIGIRYGDFYARRLIDDLGLSPQNGVVRVSVVHYNTLDEVNRLIDVFERLL
jgi:cysteine desulfurase family protein (TIGR01976 family)